MVLPLRSLTMSHRAAVAAEVSVTRRDWVCASEGVSSRRWRLGRKDEGGVRLLDMNASPPSDGDGEALVAAVAAASGGGGSRQFCFGDNTFSGNASGCLLSYPNLSYSSNGFGIQKAPTIVAHKLRLDFQDILQNKWSTVRSFDDTKHRSQLGRHSSGTTFRLPSWNSSEVLQSLREFVSEKHGILDEGWRVEFKQSKNGCESYAVYCAPDGRVFETMSDVANYLGLASNGNPLEPEARSEYGCTLRKNGLHPPKRRKLTKIPTGNGFMDNKDNLMSGYKDGFFSNLQKESFMSKAENSLKVTEGLQEENDVNDFHHFHEGLPLQYEDFFVLSLGKIDARRSYHDAFKICPVGYRSCWHDKITGSLFLCHVLDGGDSGPLFKVRRFPCSGLPIPYGSTVLQRQTVACLNDPGKVVEKPTPSEEESCIAMLFSDPCLPPADDSLSWLLSSPNEVDDQTTICASHEVHSNCDRSQDLLAHNIPTGEKIGEFTVDGHSSPLVWSILSQKLADACRHIYKQKGSLKLFCKHVEDGMSSFYDIMTCKNKDVFSSLDKFCSLMGSLKIPLVVTSDDELDSTIKALKNWLSLDRFGLDIEFVQELIEQSPDVHRCSRYESLKRRNDCLTAPLVRNGLLLINGKSMEQCKQDTVLDGLYKEYRTVEEPASSNHSRPPGKQLGAKLPPHLVGDVLQVWELLRRFHEVLGLEPQNFDELEVELISPWFESLSQHGSCERDSPVVQAVSANGSSIVSEHTSSSSDIAWSEENRFIEMQSTSMREEAHARLALSTDNNCNGISLRKAHISLLDVLVSELQIKVAAMVDPSIDAESKSRRGRRRDVDSSILAIRPKLNLLPINELTWPELARRYILAVLSMDGNPDCAETGIRECGKVFRCLQGDGGVLCGSLVGVVGIEADALLLAEARKRIYGCLSSGDDHLVMEEDDPEPVGASGAMNSGEGNIPEWAQALEPVRKLPTNVGTRIRKCVYEALNKNPPDWARKILQHSISKEVYKGNASGPTKFKDLGEEGLGADEEESGGLLGISPHFYSSTFSISFSLQVVLKKAVLSVLADVLSECSQQKVREERKRTTIVSISDTIMRKCRILLRRAASADDEKMFCNLVGRNLIHSSENDDEGLLGSPGMVSRPLDFRTIDLRLAFGVYNGSPEAFLEDVRELWKNVRVAHIEHPELVQKAERLSENFETLYEEEVVALVGKLKEYSEMEQITAEVKKEIEDVVASTNDIPKAPWDEGVCKVCGIDKDDDSVLLCDTCDAEYHTYCLDPPLARIPEGNWYCPSCVSGVSMLEATSKGVQLLGQRHRRKNHGEGIRSYLEELARLAAVMEQKEYWDFSVEERILLLKFLSDEVLNSILIRQHIEQCFETSADLQQKLRTLYSEWKNLKQREDTLAATTSCTEHAVTERGEHIPTVSDKAQARGDTGALQSVNHISCQNVKHTDKIYSSENQVKQPVDSECQVKDLEEAVNENIASLENDQHERSSKRLKRSSQQDCSVSNAVLPYCSGMDSESSCQDQIHEHGMPDVSAVCGPGDMHGVTVSSCSMKSGEADHVSCPTNVLQASNLELNAAQKELSVLHQSIANAESQLLKSSVRMEFLGSDALGRLYWASSQPGAHPRIIVDGTMAVQPRMHQESHARRGNEGNFFGNPSCISDGQGGSKAACPFVYGHDRSRPTSSQWVCYQSQEEVKELVRSLKLNNPKERELKDSILNWQKLRCHELHQTGIKDKIPSSVSVSAEENDATGLVTRADTLLERKYGPFCQEDPMDDAKKRLRRSRGTSDEKLLRCKCLEPIWVSRHHCLSCHTTFYTAEELDSHKSGTCRSSSTVPGKNKESDEPVGSKFMKKSKTHQHFSVETDGAQASKGADSVLSRHVRFQNEGLLCPYKLEEISSKFVTNDSIKDLVRGIGLIGSEGMASFVPSASPYMSDPTLRIVLSNLDIAADVDQCQNPQESVPCTGKSRTSNVVDSGTQRVLEKKNEEDLENGLSIPGISHGRSKKLQGRNFTVTDPYCTVPESSLKPVIGRAAQTLRQLKICLLDMEAALPEEALRQSKVHAEKRRAWHAFVKTAETIFEMVEATIVLEDMIKSEYLKNQRWYWSSLSAAAKTPTLSALALRIYALDNAILYERTLSDLTCSGSLKPNIDVDQQSPSNLDSSEKSRQGRRVSSRRKRDAEG
ncbi:Methyl-CpG-binding domain-containing protein 9 [Bienertia sinuspersici]